MHRTFISFAAAAAIGSSGPALAGGSIEDRLAAMEQRIKHLEQRVHSQDKTIREKDAKIAKLSAATGADGGWFQDVDISGVVEVEAGYHSPETRDSSSDVTLATVEVGIAAQINDWASAEIVLLHEEDDTDLEVDVGTITIAPPDSGFYLTGGQFYLPFGVFDSQLVSDPLSLELGETRESALQAGFERGPAFGSLYVFNGTNKEGGDNEINNWGANVGVAIEGQGRRYGVTVGYINDIGDSDALQDALGSNTPADYTAGWSISAIAEAGPFTVIGEYISATDSFAPADLTFNGGGAQPSAWNLEAGYGFNIGAKDATVAVAVQGTHEALGLDLPEQRVLAGLSVDIMDNTSLSFEWAHDDDYGVSRGGSGESSDTITSQLAVEF